MIYPVYALRDQAAGAFLAPTLNSSDAAAKRDLAMAVNQQPGAMSFQPKDFDLYEIGSYDTENAVLTPLNPVRMVCNAASLVNANG